jgi:thiamine monophosphate synthase
MTLRKRLRLCVIPDRILGAPRSLEEQALCALRGGATAIQLRDKNASTRELYETAVTLKRLCDNCGALLIVNDRIDVALAAGADGVHLGQSDLPVPEARRLAPPGFLVGPRPIPSRKPSRRAERCGLSRHRRRVSHGEQDRHDTPRSGGHQTCDFPDLPSRHRHRWHHSGPGTLRP